MSAAEIEVSELRAKLRPYLERVPQGVNGGSYQHTVAFKEAISKGRRVMKKQVVKPGELRAAISDIQRFWQ